MSSDLPPKQCDIRGCVGVALWLVIGGRNDPEMLRFCTRHRDIIEEGLELADGVE